MKRMLATCRLFWHEFENWVVDELNGYADRLRELNDRWEGKDDAE